MSNKFWKSFKVFKIDVVVYKMTKEDVLPFPDLGFNIQTETISKGKKKYFIIDNGVSVHNSVLFDKVFLLKLIGNKGPAIGDCYTNPAYRGQSIYPFVIQTIAKEMLMGNKNTAVFMVVNQDNSSSIKGIEKAGFRGYASVNAKRWFCFYFDKNIILY